MKLSGQVKKMSTVLAEPVQYYLNLSGNLLCITQLLEREILIKHIGYQCLNCGESKEIFSMGFCKQCFFESPYAGESIIRPELSTAHLGIEDRDLAVEKEIQLQPHIVYLAHTGGVKVGVTRESQTPTRWIDQGATLALPIARTNNRYEAGIIEVELKKRLSDKTNYRKMLAEGNNDETDLYAVREKIKDLLPKDSQKFYLANSEVLSIHFPHQPVEKVTTISLEKQGEFGGILKGIKGQYLIFEGGGVINIRNHEGFVIEIDIH